MRLKPLGSLFQELSLPLLKMPLCILLTLLPERKRIAGHSERLEEPQAASDSWAPDLAFSGASAATN